MRHRMTRWGVAVTSSQPAAFMSYVRFNDRHDDGQLSQFRERLAAEVRVQTGEEFLIFQDRNDIAWGQNWQSRIDETLDAVTLLLVIITPSFFRSPACRGEVERFLAREQKLGRQDLILPVYYVSTPELDDPERRDADELARVLASRQFADWRELRFEPFTSPVVRKAIAQLAHRIRDSFWRQPSTPPLRPDRSRPAATETAESGDTAPEPAATARPVAKTEPPTHVVDLFPNRGDFTSIGAAIKAAQPGDRILVRPGLYQEGLVVDKPLEILGDGPVADIEVEAHGADALLFKANIGRVANLTLRQVGGEGKWFGVDITQGRLDMEGCDISSQILAGVAIRNGASPRLRRNRIHHSRESGVFITNDGLGTLEDNDITANGLCAVEILAGGNPTLRRNQLHDNKQSGVHVRDNGLGTLEDNDITANSYHGVAIKRGGNPTLRRNQIHDNKQSGVHVYDNGLGTLEDNDITANGLCGVDIFTGGNLTLRGNRINRNTYQAVRVQGGRGVIKDNDLTANKQGPWLIEQDSKANVQRSSNRE
jgi:F-box protein 11